MHGMGPGAGTSGVGFIPLSRENSGWYLRWLPLGGWYLVVNLNGDNLFPVEGGIGVLVCKVYSIFERNMH